MADQDKANGVSACCDDADTYVVVTDRTPWHPSPWWIEKLCDDTSCWKPNMQVAQADSLEDAVRMRDERNANEAAAAE